MSPSRRSPAGLGAAFFFVNAVVTSGCGARSALLDPPTEPSPATPPVPGSKSRSFVCAPGGAGRPMLVARVDHALVFAYRDRRSRELVRFEVPANGYIYAADVIARGERAWAYAIVAPRGDASGFAPFVEIIGLDLEGAVRFRKQIPYAAGGAGATYRLVANDHDLAILTLLETQAKLGVIMRGAEIDTFDPQLGAEADPDPRGRVLCNAYVGTESPYRFFDTTTRTLAPSRYGDDLLAGRGFSSVVPFGQSSLAYVRQSPPRLVVEDADGLRETDLSAELLVTERAFDPAWASGDWALFPVRVPEAATGRHLAIQPASGERRIVSLALPPPWKLEGQLGSYPRIDGRGEILVGATDGVRDRLFATHDGVRWEARGRPLLRGGYAFPHSFAEAGGAIVFRGFGAPPPELPPGTLAAASLQLVGPQGGEGVLLPRQDPGGADNPIYADPVLSPDGKCLAYFRNGSLQVVQSASYEADDLALRVTTGSAELAWIPEAAAP